MCVLADLACDWTGGTYSRASSAAVTSQFWRRVPFSSRRRHDVEGLDSVQETTSGRFFNSTEWWRRVHSTEFLPRDTLTGYVPEYGSLNLSSHDASFCDRQLCLFASAEPFLVLLRPQDDANVSEAARHKKRLCENVSLCAFPRFTNVASFKKKEQRFRSCKAYGKTFLSVHFNIVTEKYNVV